MNKLVLIAIATIAATTATTNSFAGGNRPLTGAYAKASLPVAPSAASRHEGHNTQAGCTTEQLQSRWGCNAMRNAAIAAKGYSGCLDYYKDTGNKRTTPRGAWRICGYETAKYGR